jgi:hypothetical protein
MTSVARNYNRFESGTPLLLIMETAPGQCPKQERYIIKCWNHDNLNPYATTSGFRFTGAAEAARIPQARAAAPVSPSQ